MFTGIIEELGTVKEIHSNGSNLSFWIESPITSALKVDQSISHNGVCLTVEAINLNSYKITAIQETLEKTNLSGLQIGNQVNLERCMQMNGRIDGHIVQGHVDTTGKCLEVKEKKGSWEYTFEIDNQFSNLIIEKGSICLNGISLTLFNVTQNTFTVAIIPYTYEHTNVKSLQIGMKVNVEFDILGKYINRMLQNRK
jgi:riboflavin synthase